MSDRATAAAPQRNRTSAHAKWLFNETQLPFGVSVPVSWRLRRSSASEKASCASNSSAMRCCLIRLVYPSYIYRH